MQYVHPPIMAIFIHTCSFCFSCPKPYPAHHNLSNVVYNSHIYIPSGDTPETMHDTFNLAILLQYFTIVIYELFCKCNGIPLGAHFIYLNSGSLLGLKMAKK